MDAVGRRDAAQRAINELDKERQRLYEKQNQHRANLNALQTTAKGDARIWFYVFDQVVYLEAVHTRHPNQTK